MQVVDSGGGGFDANLRHHADKRRQVHDSGLDVFVRRLAFGSASGLLRALVEQRIQRWVREVGALLDE